MQLCIAGKPILWMAESGLSHVPGSGWPMFDSIGVAVQCTEVLREM